MKKEIHNFALSVKDRLLNIARQEGENYQLLLIRYFHERLLYRLSISKYRDHFLLKGGALMYAYQSLKSRPTIDIDFMGNKINNDPNDILFAFRQICKIECQVDGVDFLYNQITSESINIDKNYEGVRIHIPAKLDTVRQLISIDIGFGDVITPAPVEMKYPNLLSNVPQAFIKTYSLETIVAEKFQTMIARNTGNSRMKDFFDIYRIFEQDIVNPVILQKAIITTFKNRKTEFVENHPIFSDEFFIDKQRVARWNAFLKKIRWKESLPFQVIGSIVKKHLFTYWLNYGKTL